MWLKRPWAPIVITAQHCTAQQKQENNWAATKASSTDVEKGASALRIGAVYCDRLSPCVQADVAAMATNPPTMKGKAARQARAMRVIFAQKICAPLAGRLMVK